MATAVSDGFSTKEVAPARGLAYWREMVSATFVPLEIIPAASQVAPTGFVGAVAVREIGSLRIARVRASPMFAKRSDRHIEASPDDDYFLAMHLRGMARATQNGRQLSLAPGDVALFDSTRPYEIEFQAAGAFEHLIYRIPRLDLEARYPQIERATAVRIPAASFEGRLAAPYLRTLAALPLPAPASNLERTAAAALEVLSAALAAAAGIEPADFSRHTQLLTRIKQRMILRLDDPCLSPTVIAQECFISVRQLHRVFAQDGTSFGAFVREQRLRQCRIDLADTRLANRPIASIAARWGFPSAAHFTRAFRARYGVAPRGFRREAHERATHRD
jgi:AraC-like DNA-binding protein